MKDGARSKFSQEFERFQVERPFLFGGLFGLLLSIGMASTNLLFGEEPDFQTLLMSVIAVIAASLFIGVVTRSRQKRRAYRDHDASVSYFRCMNGITARYNRPPASRAAADRASR